MRYTYGRVKINMKKEKYYWKVVKVDNSGLYTSAAIETGKYLLFYEVGKQTTALSQGVFVFTTRHQARIYKGGNETQFSRYKILKVRVTGEEIKNPEFYSLYQLELGRLIFHTSLITADFPKGTKCFKSIIPIEIVT